MIITAIVSILIGFYKEFIIIVLLILTHEIGHVLCAKAFGIKTIQVLLYPLGGISKINIDINENPMKEMLIIIMGPLFQWITYELLLWRTHNIDKITKEAYPVGSIVEKPFNETSLRTAVSKLI